MKSWAPPPFYFIVYCLMKSVVYFLSSGKWWFAPNYTGKLQSNPCNIVGDDRESIAHYLEVQNNDEHIADSGHYCLGQTIIGWGIELGSHFLKYCKPLAQKWHSQQFWIFDVYKWNGVFSSPSFSPSLSLLSPNVMLLSSHTSLFLFLFLPFCFLGGKGHEW